MKRLFILIALSAIPFAAHSQGEITEENYRKIDDAIWQEYEDEMAPLEALYEKHPEKIDSIRCEMEKVYEKTARKNEQAAIKFASTPSGLQRLFWVRLDLPKDTVARVLAGLPEKMQQSAYGKSLRMHLDHDQIKVGDRYIDAEGFTPDGTTFRLSSLEGNRILLLYGGLGCMGPEGRKDLDRLMEKNPGGDLYVAVYIQAASLEEMGRAKEFYGGHFIMFSDFLLDFTPLKILYGAQETPTCFLIDRDGTVLAREVGFSYEEFEEYLH